MHAADHADKLFVYQVHVPFVVVAFACIVAKRLCSDKAACPRGRHTAHWQWLYECCCGVEHRRDIPRLIVSPQSASRTADHQPLTLLQPHASNEDVLPACRANALAALRTPWAPSPLHCHHYDHRSVSSPRIRHCSKFPRLGPPCPSTMSTSGCNVLMPQPRRTCRCCLSPAQPSGSRAPPSKATMAPPWRSVSSRMPKFVSAVRPNHWSQHSAMLCG